LFPKKFCTNFGSFFNIILQGVAKFPPVSLKKTVTAGKGTALDSFFFRVSILDQMKDRILLPLIHSSSVFLVH